MNVLYAIVVTFIFTEIVNAQLHDAQPMVIPALGRPYVLGAFYNQPTDDLLLGLALWDRNNMSTKVFEKDLPHVKTNIVGSATDETISATFGISAHVKVEMCKKKLILEGGVEFAIHKATSSNYAVVNFIYQRRTHMREMTMAALTHPDYGNLLDRKIQATHVVSGIEYGANVVYRLKRRMEKGENTLHIGGELKLGFTVAIGTITGGAKVDINISSKFNEANTECEFMGDVNLPSPPVTYDQAVRSYQSLAQLINKKTAIPINVHLTPLVLIDSKANKLVRQISESLLDEVSHRMHLYNNLEDSLEDVKETSVYGTMPMYRDLIMKFSAALTVHKMQFQKKLLVVLPEINGGGRAEEELMKVLDESSNLYSMNQLKSYIRWKITEAGALEQSCSSIPFALVTNPGGFYRIMYNDTIRYALVFTFYLYDSVEYFTECIRHACSKNRDEWAESRFCSKINCLNYPNYTSWIQVPSIAERMSVKFAQFKRAAAYNRNISAQPIGQRTALVIRGKKRGKEKRHFAVQLYDKATLKFDDVIFPFLENVTKTGFKNATGFSIKWDLIDKSQITLRPEKFLVQHSYPWLNEWKNITVSGENETFIPSVCNVDVRVAIYCVFGLCADNGAMFDGLNNDDITCNKKKLEAYRKQLAFAHEEEIRRKAFEFNKTKIIVIGGKNMEQTFTTQRNILVYQPSKQWTKSPRLLLKVGRNGHIAQALSSGRILVADGYFPPTSIKTKRNADNKVWNSMNAKMKSLKKRRRENERKMNETSQKTRQKREKKDSFPKDYRTLLINLKEEEIKPMNDMTNYRIYAASAIIEDRVYVCGGFDKSRSTAWNKCEIFADGWWYDLGKNMHYEGRGNLALVATDREEIYAIGGRVIRGYSVNYVEKYSVKKHEWKQVRPMIQDRCDLGAAYMKGVIYVCGGESGFKALKSCEKISTTNRYANWESFPGMGKERASFSLLPLLDGNLYAFYGRANQTKYIRQIDAYDPFYKKWFPKGEVAAFRAYTPAVLYMDDDIE